MVSVGCVVWLMAAGVGCQDMWEESHKSSGCLGIYDRYKMAHLERVCDECFELYKEQGIHKSCRSHCFGSKTFFDCMDAVALDELRKEAVLLSWESLRSIK
ncbi:hypothetical protein JTE90_024190 [Oedothorax gibbosus]|uniref:Ion transport peptide n=1 Tax=Oedothorax gibbosus TaxID=931172 RepID=A0AAV6UD02_9ARAC|nr:hypothetical protein JTE90_024190 [Oedothorax gibbosus]